jgi:hypothetical protein
MEPRDMPTTIALVRPVPSFAPKTEVTTAAVLVTWAIALLLVNLIATVHFQASAPDSFQLLAMF